MERLYVKPTGKRVFHTAIIRYFFMYYRRINEKVLQNWVFQFTYRENNLAHIKMAINMNLMGHIYIESVCVSTHTISYVSLSIGIAEVCTRSELNLE